MSTRSSTRNLFPPLEDPECTIRRRTRVEPNSLNDFKEISMAANEAGNDGPPPAGGDGLPVLDLRTMEELCQPTLNGRDTFYNGLTLRHRDTINAAASGTFMKRRPEECYDLIENMTAHHNDWDTSAKRSESSSSITYSNPEIAALKLEMAEINKNLMKMLQTNQQVNFVTPSCETCGGPHSYINCPATIGQTQNIYALSRQSSGSGTLPSNTVTNPREDLKGITTRSGVAYQGPTISTTSSSPPKVVERETKVTKDTVLPINNGGPKTSTSGFPVKPSTIP
ncbi:hypothetical protein Tco_1500311 [Tanacetum coccineum]